MAHTKCLLAVHGDLTTLLRKDTVDSRDSLVYSPTSQVCLSLTSWHQLNSTGPSAEHSQCRGQLPVPSASQSGLTLRLAPICPLPTAQTATPWILPIVAEHRPTLSLSHPLCLSGIFPRWGTVAQVLGERPKSRESGSLGCSVAWTPKVSCQPKEAPPSFLPSPHLPPAKD